MSIKIVDSKSYLPKQKILNNKIEEKFSLKEGYIYKRTGIKERYYVEDESIEEMAIGVAKRIKENNDLSNLGLIIVATTSSKNLMPGIANEVQKSLKIKSCISLDILAGCSGFINSFDIARLYVESGKVEKALIIGVDLLSKAIDKEDLGTVAVLSDGAGGILIEKDKENKKYFSNIKAEIDNKGILTYNVESNLYMNGKEVYKYAVTNTVENIKELLNTAGENLENIKYIVPHQSNLKIMRAIATRLDVNKEKIYINIGKIGNTFCASIPIAISDMLEQNMLKRGDKIILLGYGGGLNTGSILLEF